MIELGTLAGLHEHAHELHADCLPCDRWSVLDLERMVSGGGGSMRLPIRVRCRECGELGQLQIRPPMPTWSNTNGWIPLA